jgi:hypothetical protein
MLPAGRALLAAAILVLPVPSTAQLRPLEQMDWGAFANDISAQVGVSRLFEQRASLAGTTGDLWELGNFSVAWRTGRVVIEAGGTAQRFLDEDERFAPPYPGVRPSDDNRIHDSGDYRIATMVRLTPRSIPFLGAVRFGTRLPTTDNKVGLDRDAIDFFATVGGAFARGRFGVSGNAGLGIHATRDSTFEQDDVLLYSLRGELRGRRVAPSIELIGQKHGPSHREIRGVEDLGEIRIGLKLGERTWMRIEGVRGYETFSPRRGLIVTAGWRR